MFDILISILSRGWSDLNICEFCIPIVFKNNIA
jgi:hypothetical protein